MHLAADSLSTTHYGFNYKFGELIDHPISGLSKYGVSSLVSTVFYDSLLD